MILFKDTIDERMRVQNQIKINPEIIKTNAVFVDVKLLSAIFIDFEFY